MDQRRHIGGCWHVSDRRIHSSYQLCQKLCQLCQPLCQLCQPPLCQPFPQPPLPQPPFLQPPLRQPKPPPQLGHSPSCAASATEPCRSLNSTSETPARISLSRSATLALGASSFRFSDAASPCTVASNVEIPRTPAGSSTASACFTRLRTVIGRLRYFGCAQAITAYISRQLILCKIRNNENFLPLRQRRFIGQGKAAQAVAPAQLPCAITSIQISASGSSRRVLTRCKLIDAASAVRMERHPGMPRACWLRRIHVKIHDNRFLPVADYDCLANLFRAGIDFLMRHVRRHIDEIPCLSFST